MSSVCRSIAAFLPVLLVILGLPAAADPDQETARQRRETVRAKFVEDQEPVENLQAMAATPCVNGFAGSYPCSEIDLVKFMPLSSVGGGSANDVWGWTDPMTGNEYAIMGRTSGTSFVDITDPVNPVYLGNLPPHGANSSWRDIKVYADHAYIVSEASGHGMQVFDLTQLRSVAAPPVTFSETAHYNNFGSCHNLAINEDTGFAYAVGTTSCAGGPHFVDLADPVNPVFAGCHPETLYTHDTQCVAYNGPDADYTGREICFNSNETRVNVIDVTDHSNSSLISSTVYSGTGYVHQGWLTEDQRYYMQGDELDEQNFGHNTRTRILDMTDLDQPLLIGNFDHQTAAIDHNLYTLNGHVYMANYRAGLRIMDLDDIASGVLTEVGYFDIYPSSNSPSFNGAWSVYPYFDSGVVVVSGIEQGLFILQPRFQPDFLLDAQPATVSICEPGLETVDIQLTDDNAYVGNVSLSVTGLPSGAIETFSVNPVAVPGNSTLTIDVAGSAPGNYTLTVGATDGTLTHDTDVQLAVTDTIPGTATAVSPPHGSIDIPRVPLLQWTAASQAAEYTVEISTDPGFSSLSYSATTTATTHIVALTLDTTTTYFWRILADNACGTGVYSATSAFTTLDVPDLLVVDDDDNGPDVRPEYSAALTALGRDYNVWDTNNTDDEPSAAALAPYNAVVWFSGDEFGGAAGPGAGGEQALASWLDGGGCLLISSQDYFYDRGLTGFMSSHLGVSSATSDITSTTADGSGSVFTGIGPYNLSLPYPNYSDGVFPDATAERAFLGDLGSIAINKDGVDYRTAYLGFGLEGLPTSAAVESTLSAFLTWCDALLAQDDDSDGTPNGDDCAPQNSSVWSSPSAVYGLTVSEAPADNLAWSQPAVMGASTVTYDLLRSSSSADFLSASCVESDGTDTIATDNATPNVGQVYHYLIRVENACGDNLGNGGGRSAVNCP
jgi:choice-of-anchor B domain-containing protein